MIHLAEHGLQLHFKVYKSNKYYMKSKTGHAMPFYGSNSDCVKIIIKREKHKIFVGMII